MKNDSNKSSVSFEGEGVLAGDADFIVPKNFGDQSSIMNIFENPTTAMSTMEIKDHISVMQAAKMTADANLKLVEAGYQATIAKM